MQIVHVKHFATSNNRFISFEGLVVEVTLDGAIGPTVDLGNANHGIECTAALNAAAGLYTRSRIGCGAVTAVRIDDTTSAFVAFCAVGALEAPRRSEDAAQ